MVMKAATLFDKGEDGGSRPMPANISPPRQREACHTAMLTLGGMGYAQDIMSSACCVKS